MDQLKLAIVLMAVTDSHWDSRDAHGRRRDYTAAELDALADFGWHMPDVRGFVAACRTALRVAGHAHQADSTFDPQGTWSADGLTGCSEEWKESFMHANTGDLRTTESCGLVSRRATLRGLAGAGIAALALGVPRVAGADSGDRIAEALFAPASDDPAAVIKDYVAAVNAGDLEGILALYADDAVHIFLPTADGSAGVCLGKDQFRMWYEQSLADGDRIAVPDGTLAVDGNQAAYVTRISSDPWTTLGLEALEAHADMVLIDGRITTHVVILTPESVRQLQTVRETAAAAPMASNAWASTQQFPGQPY
jgi:ketosteroid isomerase-like protein